MYTATTLVTTFVPPIVSVWKKKIYNLAILVWPKFKLLTCNLKFDTLPN